MFSKNQLYVSPEGSIAIQPSLCVILFFRKGTALDPATMDVKSFYKRLQTWSIFVSSTPFLIDTHMMDKVQLFVPNWLVSMMSLASREVGVGLLRANR